MFCHKIYYIERLKYYSKQKYNAMKKKKEEEEINYAKSKRKLVCFSNDSFASSSQKIARFV